MLFSFLLSATLAFSLASAQTVTTVPTCDQNNKCPQDTPCCSQYGQCGVGAYCLIGCDPRSSFSLNSCAPAPACKSAQYKFDSLDGFTQNTDYLGDASKTDWVVEGRPVLYGGDSILLTMAPDTVGTLLAGSHYVWYGKITATIKASRGAGVVTAFIMMSDVKDEIDFEFVGMDNQAVQSNWYYQGITVYTNGENITASNTDSETHTYTYDWTPDQITWSVDGSVLRTQKKSATFNTTTNSYHYPQTPSRFQISLWPAGLASNGQGTVNWAGGLINWNSPFMTNGYYAAQLVDLSVECYDPPPGANIQGSQSYIYTDYKGTQDSVSLVNKDGILASIYASGENMNFDPNGDSSNNNDDSGSTPPPPDNVQTVPGIVGGGVRGTDGSSDDGTSAASGGGSYSSVGTNPLAGNGGGSITGGGFIQGDDSPGGMSGAGVKERAQLGASAFAALVGFFALFLL